jgi:hypothetical protein
MEGRLQPRSGMKLPRMNGSAATCPAKAPAQPGTQALAAEKITLRIGNVLS